MRPAARIAVIALALATVAVGCTPPSTTRDGNSPAGSTPGARSGPKVIAMAVLREQDLRPTGTGPQRLGRRLIHQGPAGRATNGERAARLAEQVASLENGLWKLLPDGRMETTWKLRQGARWHDGAPLTTDDLLFSLQVGRDHEMTAFGSEAYPAVDG